VAMIPQRETRILLMSFVVLASTACGSAASQPTEDAAQGVHVTVSPDQVSLAPLVSASFVASVTGSVNLAVKWTATAGTIDANGVYVAPLATGTYQVRATSVANGAFATAAVTVSGGQGSCDGAQLRSTGTTYYYCDCQSGADPACVAGNDANAGTSPGAPRRSLANAWSRFQGMNGGDTVALCRGGVWNADGGGLDNSRCSAASTCDLRDYVPSWGSGATARPRINASSGAMVFNFTGGAPGRGFRLWNLDVREPIDSGGNGILFFYNDKRNIDVCNVRFEGAKLHVNLDHNGTGTSTDASIVIRNSQFYSSQFAAFYGGNSGLVLDGNYFENNGLGATEFEHSVYLNGISPGIFNPRVTNNDFVVGSYCVGVIVVLHEQIHNAVVANNRITTTSSSGGCYGIQSGGSWAAGNIVGATYQRNRINMGSAGTGLEASACAGCTVTDNVIIGGGLAIGTTVDANTPATSNTTVQNNTIYQAEVSFGSQTTGSIYENNAVWTNATSCVATNGSTFTRNANDYCRTSGGVAATTVFVNPSSSSWSGDFRPAATGPLVGAGSSTNYSPTAIGSVSWSPTDAGAARTPPIDIGAFIH
jgi:hypothetical protein